MISRILCPCSSPPKGLHALSTHISLSCSNTFVDCTMKGIECTALKRSHLTLAQQPGWKGSPSIFMAIASDFSAASAFLSGAVMTYSSGFVGGSLRSCRLSSQGGCSLNSLHKNPFRRPAEKNYLAHTKQHLCIFKCYSEKKVQTKGICISLQV